MHAKAANHVCSTDSLLADAVGEASPDEVAEIAMDVGTQSMTQEEDWEDLADTKVC